MTKNEANLIDKSPAASRSFRKICHRVSCAVGFLLFGGATYFLLSHAVNYAMLRHGGHTAQGRISSYKTVEMMRPSSGGLVGLYYDGFSYPVSRKVEYPIVSFTDNNGAVRHFMEPRNGMAVGDKVEVVYAPEKPENAELVDDGSAYIRAFAGVLTLLLALLLLALPFRGKNKPSA